MLSLRNCFKFHSEFAHPCTRIYGNEFKIHEIHHFLDVDVGMEVEQIPSILSHARIHEQKRVYPITANVSFCLSHLSIIRCEGRKKMTTFESVFEGKRIPKQCTRIHLSHRISIKIFSIFITMKYILIFKKDFHFHLMVQLSLPFFHFGSLNRITQPFYEMYFGRRSFEHTQNQTLFSTVFEKWMKKRKHPTNCTLNGFATNM